MSNPRFPLHLTPEERKALRVAAAQVDMTMTDFVREAIREKIARQTQTATGAATNDGVVLAEAKDKPA